MSTLKPPTQRWTRRSTLLLAAGAALATAAGLTWGPALAEDGPLAKAAELKIAVSPGAVAAGGEAEITVKIEPIAGVKINRYPKIKLEVPAKAGVNEQGYAEIGNAKPPPPDDMESNYYKTVDTLALTLKLDSAAKPGTHEIDGKLTYFYCVAASGFCAPARVPVQFKVAVR